MYQLFQCLHVSDVLNRPAATTACTSYVVPPIASDAGYLLKVSASFIAQQCSDAIKRAQILKEKMGLPKSVAMPAAQMQQPAALQSLQQLPGSTTSSQQEESDEQGPLERQGSLPNQQPASGRGISKAISVPAGSSNLLRAYAAGAINTSSPVEESLAASPNSPQRSVLGESYQNHFACLCYMQFLFCSVQCCTDTDGEHFLHAGEIGNGHDGIEQPITNKSKQKAGPSLTALNSKPDMRTAVKDANKFNKAAWI